MDNLTAEQRRKNMQNIRSKNTTPERMIMRALKERHIYFAAHVSTIRGKPDIVFRRKRVAVFIDSDFWHGHPVRCIMPKSNPDYWSKKIATNRQRDEQVTQFLQQEGWTVIRLWEYDIKHNFKECLDTILKAIGRTE